MPVLQHAGPVLYCTVLQHAGPVRGAAGGGRGGLQVQGGSGRGAGGHLQTRSVLTSANYY